MQGSCKCGEVAFEVRPVKGTRAVCYCPYCREFGSRAGEGAIDAWGGSEILQIAPEQAVITKGAEKLNWIWP